MRILTKTTITCCCAAAAVQDVHISGIMAGQYGRRCPGQLQKNDGCAHSPGRALRKSYGCAHFRGLPEGEMTEK